MTVMRRFFTAETLAANPPSRGARPHILLATEPAGYAGCCAAIRDMDQTAAIAGIRVPTLVISGLRDVSLPWEGHGEGAGAGDPRRARRASQHRSPVESRSATIVYRGAV